MKKLLFAAIAFGAAMASTARTTVDLQGTVFNVDTIRHYYIAPGVTQSVLRFTAADRAFNAAVTTYDRQTATDVVPQVIIGRDSCNTAETVSSMAARHTTADRQVIAGINGDFFITSSFAGGHEFGNAILGYPNVTCMIDRKLAAPDIIDKGSRENCLVIADDNWYIDCTDLKYRLLNNDGSTVVDAAAVNYPRRGEEMVIYNHYAGKYTSTGQDGREITLRLAPGAEWAINKSVKFVAETDWRQGGCSAIPEDGIVISCGPNYANEFIDGIRKGDIVKMKIVCQLPAFNVKPAITDVVGGDVRILKENVTTTEAIRWINTPTARYSRSMVGYDRERRHMVMCSVDAGSPGTSGVTYFEGADVMRFLGCWDALDLDGGGSTEMWSAAHGVVNTLRDGAERAVGNALFLTLKAPADAEVVSIRFADPVARLPLYASYTPVIYGYNRYGQLVDTNVRGFALSTDAALGTTEGETLLVSGEGCHALTATLGDMNATIAVTVDNSSVAEAVVSEIVTDQYHSWPIELEAQVGDKRMPVAARAYSWTSDNPAAVTVDSEGRVTGVANGEATVTGTANAGSVSVKVISQCPPSSKADIVPGLADASLWTIGKASVSGQKFTALGENGGFALDFKVTSTRGPQITASRLIQVWGLPDALEFVINPGEIALGEVTLSTRLPGRAYNEKTSLPALEAGKDNLVSVPVSAICDAASPASYPLSFNSLRFSLKEKGTYHIEVKSLRAVYDKFESGVGNISADTSSDYLPFTLADGTVTLPFVAETLEAHDLTGRLVSSASNTSALRLNSGFYILTARFGGRTLCAKVRI